MELARMQDRECRCPCSDKFSLRLLGLEVLPSKFQLNRNRNAKKWEVRRFEAMQRTLIPWRNWQPGGFRWPRMHVRRNQAKDNYELTTRQEPNCQRTKSP